MTTGCPVRLGFGKTGAMRQARARASPVSSPATAALCALSLPLMSVAVTRYQRVVAPSGRASSWYSGAATRSGLTRT